MSFKGSLINAGRPAVTTHSRVYGEYSSRQTRNSYRAAASAARNYCECGKMIKRTDQSTEQCDDCYAAKKK